MVNALHILSLLREKKSLYYKEDGYQRISECPGIRVQLGLKGDWPKGCALAGQVASPPSLLYHMCQLQVPSHIVEVSHLTLSRSAHVAISATFTGPAPFEELCKTTTQLTWIWPFQWPKHLLLIYMKCILRTPWDAQSMIRIFDKSKWRPEDDEIAWGLTQKTVIQQGFGLQLPGHLTLPLPCSMSPHNSWSSACIWHWILPDPSNLTNVHA